MDLKYPLLKQDRIAFAEILYALVVADEPSLQATQTFARTLIGLIVYHLASTLLTFI